MPEHVHPHEDLAAAVHEAVDRLGQGQPPSRIRKGVVSALSPRRGTVSLDEVEALHRDLAETERIVATLIRKAVEQQEREALAHPFEEAWLGQTRRLLRQAAARSPQAWRARWLTSWCHAVSSSQWTAAQQVVELAQEPQTPALPVTLPRLLANLVTALKDPDERAALDVLALVREEVVPPADPLEVRLTLGVLSARAHLRLGEVAAGLDEAQEVATAGRKAGSALSNLCQAVLAEALLEDGDLDEAAEVARTAREGKDAGCDALVVSGLVERTRAEVGADTVVADDYYDVAALRFGPEATRGHLLQPVPPQLCWRVARRLRLTDAAASLELYTRAIDEGLADQAADSSLRQALAERASVLEELERGQDAARDLRRAAGLYLPTQPDTAIRLLRSACRVDPHDATNYWELGEALRLSIDSGRPRQAERRATEAQRAFADGFARRDPERDDAWTLVSAAALSRRTLSRPWQDCATDIERALLLDDGSQRSLAFLVLLLRDSGHPAAALAAVPESVLDAPTDDALVEQCALCYLGLGQTADGLALIDGFELFNYLTSNLHLIRSWLHLSGGEAADALASAEHGGDEARALLTRAMCYSQLESWDDARSLVEQARTQRPPDDPSLRPWCDYLLGEVDEAVEGYRALLGAQPEWVRDPVARLDLGQALLVRGGEADLAEARSLLLEGVAAIETTSDLVSFVEIERAPLLARIDATDHRDGALPIMQEAHEAARTRLETLRRAERPPGVDATLGAARVALAEGRAREAFDAYGAAVADGAPSWIEPGAWSAAVELVAEGDAAVREGDLDRADSDYRPVAEGGTLFGWGASREVSARRALIETEHTGGTPTPALAALVEQDGIPAIASASQVFVRDPAAFWTHHDALAHLADDLDRAAHAGRGEEADDQVRRDSRRRADELRALVGNLPLQQAFRAGDGFYDPAAAPLPMAVEMILPIPSYGLLDDPSDLRTGIPDVRQRVLEDLGVRIPGARVYESEDLSPHRAALLVYSDLAALVELDPAQPGTSLLTAFEDVVRDNVFRWLAPDDVALWLAGWDVQITSEQPLLDLPEDHVGLARVLRALLREGLSVAPRTEILEAFRQAEGQPGALAGLQAVRRALHPATLGPSDAEIVPLPESLVGRLRAGVVNGASGQWALPHAEALELREQLLSLAEAHDTDAVPRPIATRDPLLRLVVARLLASHRPRVFVVDESEWS